jgi:hypothetical protein
MYENAPDQQGQGRDFFSQPMALSFLVSLLFLRAALFL